MKPACPPCPSLAADKKTAAGPLADEPSPIPATSLKTLKTLKTRRSIMAALMPPLPLLLLLLLLPATTLSSERAVTLETPQRVGFRTPEASDRYGNGSNRGTRVVTVRAHRPAAACMTINSHKITPVPA
jgi:hypothetical protein